MHLPRLRLSKPTAIIIAAAALAAVLLTAGILVLTGAAPMSAPGLHVRFLSADPTSGVEVRLDEVNNAYLLGVTPFSATLPGPGEYTYLALAEGYHPGRGKITVTGSISSTAQIPPLRREGGEIRVFTTAPARVSVNGVDAGEVPAGTTSLGFYAPGWYTVTAEAEVGTKAERVFVGKRTDGKVNFRWGSRVVVVISPTEVPSLTLTVNGRPYRGPVSYSYENTAAWKAVPVKASAPGYFPWSGKAPLHSGEITTVTVELRADPRPGEVLAAYRRYWEVWTEAARTLDGSRLPEVMTGTLFLNWQAGLEAVRTLGSGGTIVEPAVHTPTIALLSDITATVRVETDVVEKPASGGRGKTTHLDGVYTFRRCADGVWRAASWESLVPKEAALVPTPKPGGGSGGSGGGGGSVTRPAPADRRLVASIILAAINCARQEKGWPQVVWDQELADALQPIVEEEGAYYKDHPFSLAHWKANFKPREDAVLYSMNAVPLLGSNIALSLVPSRARAGGFAGDWENYADRPCEAGAAGVPAYDEWTRPITRVGIAISTPYWTGVWWEAQIIVAGRP
ncbi:MAG: hypothetical protein QXU79_02325 [Candidatus Micrarchaeaceae archaeon]